jgi:hypothetical protein
MQDRPVWASLMPRSMSPPSSLHPSASRKNDHKNSQDRAGIRLRVSTPLESTADWGPFREIPAGSLAQHARRGAHPRAPSAPKEPDYIPARAVVKDGRRHNRVFRVGLVLVSDSAS